MSVFARIPLGWRLSLAASAAMAVVMGVSILHDARREEHALESVRIQLLEKSLAPLAFRLSKAVDRGEVESIVSEFHQAYLDSGYTRHQLRIEGAHGEALWRGGNLAAAPLSDSVRASIPVSGPVFTPGGGRIVAWEERESIERLRALREKAFRAQFFWALGTIIIVVQVVAHFFVTKPLAGLVVDLKRMERGYWGEVDIPRGAPEIRWLAERFGRLGVELRRSVEQLVEAERRSFMEPRNSEPSCAAGPQIAAWNAVEARGFSRDRQENLDLVLEELERLSQESPRAKMLAREVWEHRREELESLADWAFRGRLENAALRVLEPTEYGELKQSLGALELDLEAWTAAREHELVASFERQDIPILETQMRVKHLAGVWRKMQEKDLRLDQIHDLVALRVIVPTEADCYAALRVVHEKYEPEFGRFNDFVAHPKKNGYQSLHTCVRSSDGRVFEVQVRSASMHRVAESGSAAHWVYKSSSNDQNPEDPNGPVRGLMKALGGRA